jgi:hypothetical protein
MADLSRYQGWMPVRVGWKSRRIPHLRCPAWAPLERWPSLASMRLQQMAPQQAQPMQLARELSVGFAPQMIRGPMKIR